MLKRLDISVCELFLICQSVIIIYPYFSLQILTSVRPIPIHAMPMLIVIIPLDHSIAPVILDTTEREHIAMVSITFIGS